MKSNNINRDMGKIPRARSLAWRVSNQTLAENLHREKAGTKYNSHYTFAFIC